MTDTSHTADPDVSKTARSGPIKWWQWMLVYPTLAVSLLGATPTIMEAAKAFDTGVPFGMSADAGEQNRLWKANFECAQKMQFQTIRTKRNVEIGSVICESGDVLLKGKLPDTDDYQYRWVSWNAIAHDKQAGLSLFGSAHAATESGAGFMRVQNSPNVICQRWVGKGTLLRRVATNRICVDELVNTYNGRVMKRNPAPCQPGC